MTNEGTTPSSASPENLDPVERIPDLKARLDALQVSVNKQAADAQEKVRDVEGRYTEAKASLDKAYEEAKKTDPVAAEAIRQGFDARMAVIEKDFSPLAEIRQRVGSLKQQVDARTAGASTQPAAASAQAVAAGAEAAPAPKEKIWLNIASVKSAIERIEVGLDKSLEAIPIEDRRRLIGALNGIGAEIDTLNTSGQFSPLLAILNNPETKLGALAMAMNGIREQLNGNAEAQRHLGVINEMTTKYFSQLAVVASVPLSTLNGDFVTYSGQKEKAPAPAQAGAPAAKPDQAAAEKKEANPEQIPYLSQLKSFKTTVLQYLPEGEPRSAAEKAMNDGIGALTGLFADPDATALMKEFPKLGEQLPALIKNPGTNPVAKIASILGRKPEDPLVAKAVAAFNTVRPRLEERQRAFRASLDSLSRIIDDNVKDPATLQTLRGLLNGARGMENLAFSSVLHFMRPPEQLTEEEKAYRKAIGEKEYDFMKKYLVGKIPFVPEHMQESAAINIIKFIIEWLAGMEAKGLLAGLITRAKEAKKKIDRIDAEKKAREVLVDGEKKDPLQFTKLFGKMYELRGQKAHSEKSWSELWVLAETEVKTVENTKAKEEKLTKAFETNPEIGPVKMEGATFSLTRGPSKWALTLPATVELGADGIPVNKEYVTLRAAFDQVKLDPTVRSISIGSAFLGKKEGAEFALTVTQTFYAKNLPALQAKAKEVSDLKSYTFIEGTGAGSQHVTYDDSSKTLAIGNGAMPNLAACELPKLIPDVGQGGKKSWKFEGGKWV